MRAIWYRIFINCDDKLRVTFCSQSLKAIYCHDSCDLVNFLCLMLFHHLWGEIRHVIVIVHQFIDRVRPVNTSDVKMTVNQTAEFIEQEIADIKANINVFFLVIMGLFVFGTKNLYFDNSYSIIHFVYSITTCFRFFRHGRCSAQERC